MLSLNATLVGQIMVVWIFLATVIAYRLSLSREKNPFACTVKHFFISFLPPISLVFLLFLYRKKTINR